ncbi:MAG TPA: hypothetical protein VLM91_24670 [Candidatus Methylomirabilis sp.]|nr:hypothetical protein [Candidatus Methylomirabilis sp.]
MTRYLILIAWLLVVWPSWLSEAWADHALEFYPSFYPQEIRVESVNPASAASLLTKHAIHAYIGGDPFGPGAVPGDLRRIESLESYVVATFNIASKAWSARETRCARGADVVAALARGKKDSTYVFSPYPVTPFHADYLEQYDLAESAKRELESRTGRPVSPPSPKIRAKGRLAESLVPSAWRTAGRKWDATLETIDVEDLVAPSRIGLNGWLDPPWIKAGWFQAYLLLQPTLTDEGARRTAETIYQRLVTGAFGDAVEEFTAERKLVSFLRSGCERVVVGYTLRREYYNNSDYADGVENIAADSQDGFDSPIFIRTVKLKDFPWNGKLRLGVAGKPRAAWNPMGGFTDPVGRLLWSAVGDPAEFPAPDSSTWVPNRVSFTVVPGELPSGDMAIPKDAVLPEPGTGALRPVGEGKLAKTKIVYRVLTSAFHDQTRMTPADILYSFVFAYRWGVPHPPNGAEYDPFISASTALLRAWLAGVRLVREEEEVKKTQEGTFRFQVQVVEVYLTHTLSDPSQLAAVAPPWSSLPWHVIALMEEAVKRGFTSFSAEEAKRRGLPWLDLVRDQGVKDRLAALCEEFRNQGYVPGALGQFVTAEQAAERWTRLWNFYAARRHFLVTDGPYQLHQWSGESVVVQAFRDPTYPVSLTHFDRYPIPRRAFASKIEVQGERLAIRAEVEEVFKYQRTYSITRKPLQGPASEQDPGEIPVCRYVVVGRDGTILLAGTSAYEDAGVYRLDFTGKLKSSPATVLLGLFLGGNFVNPEVKAVQIQAGGAS